MPATTTTVRELRGSFPKVKKLIEAEGSVIVSDRGHPKYLLWRATLNRAADLSRAYSPKLGTRSLDVLHVASALVLELRSFVTYDGRQQELARAVGLKILEPGA